MEMTISALVGLLTNHGTLALFLLVLAEQAGLPAPGVPMLLAVGSLANLGRISPTVSIGAALAACLIADVFWYELGRRGCSNLRRRRSRRSKRSEERIRSIVAALKHHWLGVLFLAKFIPGPNLGSPLAGISGLTRFRFLILDSIASTVWAGVYIALGYIFNSQFSRIAAHGSRFGVGLLLVGAILCVVAVIRSMRRRWPQVRPWKHPKDLNRGSARGASESLAAFRANGMEVLQTCSELSVLKN